MLDSLQATQLQSAIVKAMYAATIESELDTEKAFEYIAGAPQEQKDNPLINILEKFSSWYDTNNVTLGGVKIPHLFPGDDLKLQTAQDSDNGFSALEQALLRYIAAGLGVSYEQLSRDDSKVSYSSARASANESWRYFMGRRKFIASRLATQMFSCWLEEALLRGIIRPPRARFDFYQARSAWSRAEWIGAGRMAIDGLKEVQKAFEYIAGAPQGQKDNPLINILEKFSSWYDTNNVTLGGVKIPHLFPGDDLKLQTAQDSDNGFSALEQALLRYIAAGLGVSYEQLSRDYSKVSYSSARASANESWRYFMGRRKFIASRLATQMFSCWLEEALLRGIIRPPRARFDFYQARSAWSRAEWIGAGRMAIDGLKEVQESVMRIEAGLSTYEKELALMGEDYQDIFRQQVRESAERQKAGLSRPVWIAQAYQQQIAESRRPEEETTPRET